MYSFTVEKIDIQNAVTVPLEGISPQLPADGQQVALRFPFCLPGLLGPEPNSGRAELKIVNNRFRIG